MSADEQQAAFKAHLLQAVPEGGRQWEVCSIWAQLQHQPSLCHVGHSSRSRPACTMGDGQIVMQGMAWPFSLAFTACNVVPTRDLCEILLHSEAVLLPQVARQAIHAC